MSTAQDPAGPQADRGFVAERLAQALRDLRWLLLSPPLLADSAAFSTPVQRFDAQQGLVLDAWLAQFQARPAPLAAFLEAHAATPLRLGRKAERLLEFFLRHGPTHRLVAANLPLRHAPGSQPGTDHTTRGEIDFLLEDEQGRPWHWELAVKFFLCTAEGEVAEAGDFVGPDRAETLPGKLHKLFGRQLAHAAPPPFDDRVWQAAAYTRGWLFYRHDRPRPHCPLLAPDHGWGQWLEWRHLGDLPPGFYLHVPRATWMAPVQAGAGVRAWAQHEVPQEMARMWAAAPPAGVRRWPTAQLIARVEPDACGWSEVQRWFVVPDGWDEAAAPQ